MTKRTRPLSPHLQIYRLPLLAILSITHRITGVGLALGTVLLTILLISGGYGANSYNAVAGFLGSGFGMLLLFGWSVALFYHLANGIRHLLWDAGRGFAIPEAYASGKVVIGVTIGLTLLAWIIGLSK